MAEAVLSQHPTAEGIATMAEEFARNNYDKCPPIHRQIKVSCMWRCICGLPPSHVSTTMTTQFQRRRACLRQDSRHDPPPHASEAPPLVALCYTFSDLLHRASLDAPSTGFPGACEGPLSGSSIFWRMCQWGSPTTQLRTYARCTVCVFF